MRSAAEALLDMYEVKKPTKVVQDIITCLLYSLTSNNKLYEAIDDLDQLSGLESNINEVAYIKSVTQLPEMVALYRKPIALRLAIALYPYVDNTIDYSKVTLEQKELDFIVSRANKTHVQSESKKALLDINSLNLGYKIIQKPRDDNPNEFHIIKYTTKEELLARMKKHKLMSPSILDKVL